MAEDKEKSRINPRTKFWLGTLFKVAMLLFGIVSLFGYFDLTGKIVGTYMLFLLWLHFDPVGLIFGKSKKWLNYVVIIIFYIFVLNTFARIIQTTNTNSDEFQLGYKPIDSFLLKNFDAAYQPFRQLIVDISESNVPVSEFSSTYGFLLLIIIALYIAFNLDFEKDSLAYPLVYLFRKSPKFWEDISLKRPKSYYLPLKFALSLICLLLFSHYFFNLVNQWMLVSIGNSTFIIAFFFVAKDIKNTGIKILDDIGSFDDEFIYFVRKIFHDPKHFLIGFSILLAFHYLSDINLFLWPYLIPSVDIDEYYLGLVGKENHSPILSLFANEPSASFFESARNIIVYSFSTLGAFFIFLVPVAFIFLSVSTKNVKDYLEKKHHRVILYAMLITMVIFILAPWISLRGLYQDSEGNILGIYGVDINTKKVSDSLPLQYLFLVIIGLLLACIKFSRQHWAQEYSITVIFLFSLAYLGLYVWHFFTSALYYYYYLILFAFSEGNLTLLILFSLLIIIETLFYVGGFLYMGYKISRYIITQKTRYIVTDNSMILWTVALLAVPAFFLFKGTPSSILTASVAITSLFLFNYALYKEFTGIEHKDDYILSVSQVIVVFQMLVIADLLESRFISGNMLLILGGVLLLALSIVSLRFFRINLIVSRISLKNFVYVLAFGIAFGILFYFIPEPLMADIGIDTGTLLFYFCVIAVAEEILFRGIVMGVSEKAFSFKRAVFLQSLVFMLIHFINPRSILDYYFGLGFGALLTAFYLFIYGALLYSFGMFAALIYKNNNRNISYPILFHFVVNLLPLLILRFF